jgi:hypothetical protein
MLPKLTQPSPTDLDAIKATALLKLAQLGLVKPAEVYALASGHVDSVLDRLFEHCGALRVRAPDGRTFDIYPQGTVQ